MFAIFESGSKQHLVKEGALVKVEKLGQDDKEIVLDRILMVSSDEKKWVGTPYVEKARIIAGEFDVFEGPIKDNTGAERVKAGESMTDEQKLSFDWLVEGVQGQIPQ